MIDLRNDVKKEEIPEKPKNITSIVEKILDFNNQQKRKELKIITPIQMLRRLPIALPKIKARNISENLLNEIC